MEACPVCDCTVPLDELQLHVQLHFLEEEPAAPSTAAPLAGVNGAAEGPHFEEQPGTVLCPLGCGAVILLEELDSHEEAHRLQELESQHKSKQQEQEAAEFEKLQMKFGFSDKRPGKCFRCGQEGHWSRDCPSNPTAQAARGRQPLPTSPGELSRVQQADPAIRQQGGIDVMAMLQSCFEAQQKPRTTVYLSGPVTFCCRGAADSGWGCGYRNIQMQASHLLLTSEQHRRALFGGAGFVPDIAALQAWLEVAWQAGFDPGGAAMFGSAVQCTRKWIGTTEAAAMLRYFGCRALIVDFYGKADQDPTKGPTIHQGVACDLCGKSPIIGVRYKSYSTPDFDVCSSCRSSQAAQLHAPFQETGVQAMPTGTPPGTSAGGQAAAAVAGAGVLPNLLHSDGGGAGCSRALGTGAAAGASASSSGGRQGGNKRKQPGAGGKHQGASRHQALAEWIWAYFSSPGFQGGQQGAAQNRLPAAAAAGQGSSSAGGRMQGGSADHAVDAFSRLQQRPRSVIMTGKPPLYFQHEGHSRTIVGIERTLPSVPQQRTGLNGGPAAAAAAVEYTLIVLDPGMPQPDLINSLRSRDKWQMKVKRGMHSLARHSELQLLYVAPGMVPEGPERDAMKRVAASERYR